MLVYLNLIIETIPIMISEDNEELSSDQLPLKLGGVITGSIGMGKTNLRFHIIKALRDRGYRILDFDYKGETKKIVTNPESVIIPGKNYKINLFDHKSVGLTVEEHTLFLKKIIESVTPDLTTPQKSLLYNSIFLTFSQRGSIDEFLSNIFYLANKSQAYNPNIEKTAFALFDKLQWLVNDLGCVFHTDKSSIDLSSNHDLYFDLSYLKSIRSSKSVIIFIEILLQLLTIRNTKVKSMIFIEEVQILLKNSDHLFLEEVITTLRHRNFGVFLCGTRLDYQSKLLVDSGVKFEFYQAENLSIPGNSSKSRPSKPYQVKVHAPGMINSKIFTVTPFFGTISTSVLRLNECENQIFQGLTETTLRQWLWRAYISDNVTYKTVSGIEKFTCPQPIDLEKLKDLIIKFSVNSGKDPFNMYWTIVIANEEYLIEQLSDLSIQHYCKRIQHFIETSQQRLADILRNYLIGTVAQRLK